MCFCSSAQSNLLSKRTHGPEEGSAAAFRAFDSALRDYQNDSAALEPHLNQYGNRSLASFVSKSDDTGYRTDANPGSFVQRIREARYAARQLPGLLERIRASLPRTLGQRFESAPVEDASAILEMGSENGPRERAADELRQLRSLFRRADTRGDPVVQPLARKEDRALSRDLLKEMPW